MTDLTEQLYAGTLPTGHYYFNNGVETYIVLYKNINSKHLILQEPEGLKVLCKVPSYEEYQALLSDQLAKNEGVEINAELEADNKRLRKEIKEWQKMARRILPALIPVQEDMATLIKTLLKVSPEHKAWLEKNYKEYL